MPENHSHNLPLKSRDSENFFHFYSLLEVSRMHFSLFKVRPPHSWGGHGGAAVSWGGRDFSVGGADGGAEALLGGPAPPWPPHSESPADKSVLYLRFFN